MANQGNLFTTSNEPAAPAVQPVPKERPRNIPRWLLILELSLFVVLRLYVGALVVLLPWRSIWTTNAWISHWPMVADFIAHGWVRGIVSGLGLLNIWFALNVLLHPRRRI
jgi:hypothetical protein